MSRPTRARGLKLFIDLTLVYLFLVAPHAGAWIETLRASLSVGSNRVAPHAGAWIETSSKIK